MLYDQVVLVLPNLAVYTYSKLSKLCIDSLSSCTLIDFSQDKHCSFAMIKIEAKLS